MLLPAKLYSPGRPRTHQDIRAWVCVFLESFLTSSSSSVHWLARIRLTHLQVLWLAPSESRRATMGAVLSLTSELSTGSSPVVHFADKPATLQVRRNDGSDDVDAVSIKTLLETRCPSLFSRFKPLWWLPKCVSFRVVKKCCAAQLKATVVTSKHCIVSWATFQRATSSGTLGMLLV